MIGCQLKLIAECNTAGEDILHNLKKSSKYPRVKLEVLNKPPCAVVGGGPGLAEKLDELRAFTGDIYAVNDTAGFLSDQGIPSYMFAVDATYKRYKTGPLVKGCLFASRVHRRQFHMFDGSLGPKKEIRVFDMREDYETGVQGGPTAVCRSCHLLLRMGYFQVVYFGIEGCFYEMTHISGNQKVALDNMIIVKVHGVDYLTNASLLMQCQYMQPNFLKFTRYMVNRSEGLIKAMIEYPNEIEVVAVAEDLKKKTGTSGESVFNKEYKLEEKNLWRQPQILSRQPL